MKTFNEFINEELSPYKYKMAASRLDKKLHKKRYDNLIDHYNNEIKKFGPINIIKIIDNEYVLFENCIVQNIDINNVFFNNNDDDYISIIFKSENNNILKWTIVKFDEYEEDGYIYSNIKYYHDENLLFTNRHDANKFLKFITSIIENDKIQIRLIDENVNDYYISDNIEMISDNDIELEEIENDNNNNNNNNNIEPEETETNNETDDNQYLGVRKIKNNKFKWPWNN